MKKIIFYVCFLMLLSIDVMALTIPMNGEYKRIYNQAEEYFVNENYSAALPLYMQVDSMEKGNANVNFKIGFCYLNAATYKTKSIPYFEAAIKNIARKYEEGEIREKQAPLATYFYLAKAYHLNYEFDKAIGMYELYKSKLGTDQKVTAEIEDVNHEIETCNYGKELIKTPIKVIVENLGEGINTKYPEYAPVVSLDEQTLIFTSRRPGGASDLKEPNGLYFEDIYVSTYENEKWGKAISIGPNINTSSHEATINLSADGQKLLVYKDDGGNGNIYVSELNGTEWGAPQYQSAPVNSSSWESHACYSSDNRIIYFVSDLPGGYGGRDIYKSLRLPNGEWGPAQNLGETINTKYDEDGVFIHPDGKQIFFSSKGHNSMGGFDIFTSMINDENGNWSTPVNYGYPVNTTDDDVFLVTTPDGRRAFFSSDKEGGYGEKDIYMIKFPDYEPRDVTILLGKIINASSEDISNNKIYILNTTKGDTSQTLTANSSTGKYGANLPIGYAYKTVYQVNGKEIFSEVLDSPKGKGYQVIKRDVTYGSSNGNKNAADTSNSTSIPIIATNTVNPDNSGNTDHVTPTDNSKIPTTGNTKDSVATVVKQCDSQKSTYQLNFKYNKKEIDEKSDEFQSFIEALVICLKADPSFAIEFESSASTVPTSTFKNNKTLADARAKDAHAKVLKALLKKGFKENQVVFNPSKSLVQGPEYQQDAIKNQATYEQYQYIKIKTVTRK